MIRVSFTIVLVIVLSGGIIMRQGTILRMLCFNTYLALMMVVGNCKMSKEDNSCQN